MVEHGRAPAGEPGRPLSAPAGSRRESGGGNAADGGAAGEESAATGRIRDSLSVDAATRRADSHDAIAADESDTCVFTAYGSARPGAAATICAAFRAVERAVAPLACEFAYTSAPVIRALERRGESAPVLEDVLERVCATGTGRIAVQPAYLMDGWAMSDLSERVRAACGERAVLGRPLLSCASDARVLADALCERYPSQDGTAYLLVAHGESWPQGTRPSERARAFDALTAARAEFEKRGRTDALLLTMADAPVAVLRACELGTRHVRIVPLMLTAGHHVERQLFGTDPGSFASRLASAGFEVETCDEGLFDLPAVRELFAAHARELCRI